MDKNFFNLISLISGILLLLGCISNPNPSQNTVPPINALPDQNDFSSGLANESTVFGLHGIESAEEVTALGVKCGTKKKAYFTHRKLIGIKKTKKEQNSAEIKIKKE